MVKRCPNCGKSFEGAALTCPVDGAMLIAEVPGASDALPSDATFNSESSRRTPTMQYSDLLGKPTVSASHDQLPELQQYLTPKNQQSVPPQRKAWPWIAAALVILFLVVAAIIGVASMISGR